MTRDEIISLVQGRMTRTDNTAYAVLEIQAAQRELEQGPYLPWFLAYVKTDLYTIAQIDTLAVPTGFIRELDEEGSGLWRIDETTDPSTDTRLRKYVSHGDMIDGYKGEDYNVPEAYSLIDGYYRFRPKPDAAYRLGALFYKADTVLTSDGTNLWTTNAPDLLAARLGMLLTRYDADKTLHDMFLQDYNQAMARLQVFDESRRQAGFDAIMGGDDL